MESLRLEYDLTEADVAAGVEALIKPSPGSMRFRPWLMRAIWFLLALSGGLIVYLEASFWRRLLRLGAPFRVMMPRHQAAIVALPIIWAALLALCWFLARDPDAALRWLRDRITRKLLASRAPGPRTLSVTPAGLEITAGGQKIFRAWTAVRRARRGEGHLVLDARDLWFIVPLHALTATDREALLAETSARVSIAAP